MRRAWAMDDQDEELDMRCLTVPAYGQDGAAIASLGVSGTVGQIADEVIDYIVSRMKDVARRLQIAIPARVNTFETPENFI